jgi:glycosyltransferase involved in cell wall biosynthesis
VRNKREARSRVLYVTSRERAYARNQTLVRAIERYAEVEIIAPAGDGRGAERRLAYAWGLARVIVKGLTRALHPTRRRDTLVVGFLAQPLAVALRPFWRGRLVADALVSVYDTVCGDKQLAAPDSHLGRIALWLDSYLVRHADALIFDTHAHREYFQTLLGALPSSFVVPVGSRRLSGASSARTASDRLQVVFAGTYVPLQGARVIADAARLLKDDPIDFTMIGTGQGFDEVAALARRGDLPTVRFLGWTTLAGLDDWYQRADVILGIFGSTDKAQRVIPNKVFEALSIGRPVITSDTPAIRELFVPGRDLICCARNDPASLADAIRWAATHRAELQEIARAGKAAFERRASEAALAAALQPVFEHE